MRVNWVQHETIKCSWLVYSLVGISNNCRLELNLYFFMSRNWRKWWRLENWGKWFPFHGQNMKATNVHWTIFRTTLSPKSVRENKKEKKTINETKVGQILWPADCHRYEICTHIIDFSIQNEIERTAQWPAQPFSAPDKNIQLNKHNKHTFKWVVTKFHNVFRNFTNY